MRDYLNLSKPLTEPSSQPPPPPSPPPEPKSNMPMLYYGLVVVATAAIVLAIYNLIIVRWCANQYRRSREANNQLSGRRRNATTNRNIMLSSSTLAPSSSLSRDASTVGLVSSFRYKKAIIIQNDNNTNKTELDYDIECSVCLSVFEDGEEVRRLPRCNHSFHASCIDMWLYSHSDCPMCRAPVAPPQHRHTELSEPSRDGLLDRDS